MVVDLQRILNVIATLIRGCISSVSAVVSSVEALVSVERLRIMETNNWLDEAMLDLTIFRLKHREAVQYGLLDDYKVWQRWLV